MGGVCSGGTKERNTKIEKENTRGFSGKLKSKKSLAKQKGNSDSRSYANGDGFDKARQRHDSGDFGLQFSRELKPSTPARTAASKVLFALTILFVVVMSFKVGAHRNLISKSSGIPLM